MRREMNMDLYNEMDFMVCDYYGHIDEYVYSDLLFIVKFGLGLVRNYEPDDYMYDIFDRLDVVEGRMEDDELVKRIVESERAHKYDEWRDVEVLMAVKDYLMNKEQA